MASAAPHSDINDIKRVETKLTWSTKEFSFLVLDFVLLRFTAFVGALLMFGTARVSEVFVLVLRCPDSDNLGFLARPPFPNVFLDK